VRVTAAGVTLLAATTGLSADDYSEVSGFGGYTCEVMLEIERNDGAAAVQLFEQWIAGFITGRNLSEIMAGEPPLNLRIDGTDPAFLYAIVRRSCRAGDGSAVVASQAELALRELEEMNKSAERERGRSQ